MSLLGDRRLAVGMGAATALAVIAVAAPARAGGGPMNVMVLYSADDADAVEVAEHYRDLRSLPPGQLCPLPGITPAMTTIDVAAYRTLIQEPLDACLAALPEPEEIDYLVLVRGLPYSVTLATYAASLQAVLQVHHAKGGDGTELAGQDTSLATGATVNNPVFPPGFGNPGDYTVTNPYGNWYSAASTVLRARTQPPSFRRSAAPDGAYDFAGNLFIVSALDGFDYQDAKALVDRAVEADGSMPTAELMCMRGEDEARAARDPECELVTRMLSEAGMNGKWVDAFDPALSGHTVAAYFTGSADTVKNTIAENTYVPGAITDNLTSYGAGIQNFFCNDDGSVCPASEGQTSIARYVRAGATGAHGTVNEPLNNVFPNAATYLYYTFGYSMGESYFYNQRFLYWQNVYLGDPLTTPYAQRPVVTIAGGVAELAEGQPLLVEASHPDGIARIVLYVGGARVAEGAGDNLSYQVTGKAGDELDAFAVAFADNAPVERKGWPQPSQQPQPDVQGWSTVHVTLVEAGSDAAGATSGGVGAAGGNGPGAEEEEEGCACRAAARSRPGSGALLGIGIGLAAMLRRRSRARCGESRS